MRQDARPRLARHARLRFDERRGAWVVLAPERVLMPDEIAVAVLERCTGAATLAEIVDDLARVYSADRAEIAADVAALLQELTDKGVIEA